MRRRSPRRDALCSQLEKHSRCKRRPDMKKNTNTKQNASKGKRTEQKETFAFYIGIALGDKNSDVCVLNSSGDVHKEFRIRMTAPAIDAYFAGIGQSPVPV